MFLGSPYTAVMKGCGPFVIVVWLVAGASATAAAAPNPEQSAGLALMESRGCLACHSTDGTRSVGPTLLGLAGSWIAVARHLNQIEPS